MTRDQHKEVFHKIEEMFWAKETKMIVFIGLDPDDHAVAVTGPDTNPIELMLTVKKVIMPILDKMKKGK